MKIGFSGHYSGPGGARAWLRAFSQYLELQGHEVIYGPDPTVDTFCSIANLSTVEDLTFMKSHNIKILQRLGAIYLNYNHPNQEIINGRNANLRNLTSFADTIIYQSHFSKEVLFRSIYDGQEPDGHIIYNTTTKSFFTPEGPILEDRPKDKKLIIAMAYWGTPHTSIISIKLLVKIARMLEAHKDIELWVLGRAFPENEAMVCDAHLSNVTKLNLHEPIPYEMVPTYLRTADMILHLKAHEGCSNQVLETMHIGTPLVGIHSGSLPELVNDAALLANCTSDISTFPEVDVDDLYNKILYTLDNLGDFSQRMVERSKLFQDVDLYEQYLTIIKDLASPQE